MPHRHRTRAVAAGAVTALALLVGLSAVHQVRHERDVGQRRAEAAQAVNTLRTRLEEELHARLYLTDALAAYVKAHPELTDAAFMELARLLTGKHTAIRSLQLARDTVISHVYPRRGNEAAVGLHLLELRAQREPVARALRLRDTVVAGPVDLVQGGTAFIARTPILVPRGGSELRYWGLASVVIDMEGLFQAANLWRWSRHLRLAIQGSDSKGPAGQVFFGEGSVFRADPVETTVRLPNGSWRLAAVPENGWSPRSVHDVEFWLFGALLTAAGGVLVGLLVYRPEQLAEANRWLQREIADHKRTAELLQQSRDELVGQKSLQETLLNTIPVPAFMKDAEGRYLTCNPAFEEYLGVSRRQLVGRTVFELAPADLAQRYRAADDALLRTGSLQIYEANVQCATGEQRTVQFYKARFHNPDGSVGGLVGAMLDVTERKEAERELQAARRRAEQAVEERTRFVAAASHDLRQPLHALSLFVGQLEERARAIGDLQGLARDIRLCTDSLVELFDTLMDISKLDAGAVAPAMEELPVRPLLDRLATDHSPLAAQHGLQLRVAGPPLTVRTDPALLERLLRNLLANALKYTARGGVLLACRRRGDTVRIEVWDTGPGIPEAEQTAIFREFYQGEDVRQEHAQGLGLGLSIVQRLATLMDHPLDLCSRPGHGSVFRLQVPAASAAPQPAAVAAPGVPGLAGLRVLAVDDEQAALEALRGSLEDWGCEVATARDREEAVRQASRFDGGPDVVLCDYRLGHGEYGTAVIGRLRQHLGPDLRAALITGDTSEAIRTEAQAADCRLLHKPVRPAKLRALLAGWAASPRR